MSQWQGFCTACGKKQTISPIGDPNKSTNSYSSYIPGKCPNTKDGKHIAVWTKK